jgi:hypothetical protein
VVVVITGDGEVGPLSLEPLQPDNMHNDMPSKTKAFLDNAITSK